MPALPPFQTLLDRYAGDVLATLRGAVGRGDADDVFQETFLAALRAYPRLRDDRNLRGWLLTIARRKAVDHHRARGRRPLPVAAIEEVADAASQPLAGGASQPLAGGASQPLADAASQPLAGGAAEIEEAPATLAAAAADDGVWEKVAALPPKQRAAVALRFAGDLPHAEIAAALGCSPAAARRSLHEGLTKLRKELS